MKKFFKSAAILTLGFGLAMTFTACHHSDGEAAPEAQTVFSDAKTLVVKTNVPAKFSFGKYNSGTTAKTSWVISESDFVEGWQLVITPADASYMAQSVTVYYAAAKENGLVIYDDYREFNINLQAKSTTSKTAAEADASGSLTVHNDAQNRAAEGVSADLVIDNIAGNIKTPGSGNDYSIIVYTPAAAGAVIEKDALIQEPVYAIACTPDGTVFNTPAKVTMNIQGANKLGMKVFYAANPKEVLTDGNGLTRNPSNILVNIPHFSEWMVTVEATVVDMTTEYKPIGQKEVGVTANQRAKTKIDRNVGYELNATVQPLVEKYLDQTFSGKKRTSSYNFAFTPTETGTAVVTFEQAVRTVKLQSGESTFTAIVYGAVRGKVTYKQATHSGGSNSIR